MNRIVSETEMLEFITLDWPAIEVDYSGVEVTRLEPSQGAHNMFFGKTAQEALRKAILTPAFKGPYPMDWRKMTTEEKLAANVDGVPFDKESIRKENPQMMSKNDEC